ncbi:MAG TPA: ACP S-malonyltransferase [candidate division Zixibacteria bacterium]|nr:ACP S-malonyltransferase [candidate division Zixibacteria bacterium]
MSKTVLMFPGQASQYVGMAKDLYAHSDDVKSLYKLASQEIGEDIAKLSFDGPQEKLKETRFTQPAILLHSLAVLKILNDILPRFDYTCGHSLGEYGALAVSGVISFEDAVKAVVKRASLMEDACRKNPGTMAAIIGLDENQVAKICKDASKTGIVVPANFNSKNQIVISGEIEAVKSACELAKSAGAKRALLLEVGGAFHSPLMQSAREGLKNYLENIKFNEPKSPVIANVTAAPVKSSVEIKKLLVEQITAPVKWSHTMEFLSKNSVTTVIEIGPGKVLSGMAKRDMQAEKIVNLDTLADVEAFSAVTA